MSNRVRGLALASCILLMACGAPPAAGPVVPTSAPTQPSEQDLPSYRTTTLIHGEVANAEARRRFLEAYGQGEPGRWELVTYTTEGDPISYRLAYYGEGERLLVVRDNTQDKFAGQGDRKVREYECESLVGDAQALRAVLCRSASGVESVSIP